MLQVGVGVGGDGGGGGGGEVSSLSYQHKEWALFLAGVTTQGRKWLRKIGRSYFLYSRKAARGKDENRKRV